MVLILIIVAVVIFCVAPGKMTAEAKKMAKAFQGLNCAHRGLHTENQQIPENSLPSFEAARKAGYGVELDVQLSKDGQVVVFHDDDLKRACGVDKLVNSLNWEELSTLPLFGTQECMPLLVTALDVLGDAPVIVELKPAGANNAKLCTEVLKIMRTYGKRWCIESFDPRIVGWFRKNAPDVLRGQLSAPPAKFDTLSKGKAFLLGNVLLNFISRPHFLAYNTAPPTLIVKLCKAMKPMNVAWTVRPGHDIAKHEKENDCVIFEYYMPTPLYKQRLNLPPV